MLNKLKAFAPQLKIAAAIVVLLALSFACFMKAGGMRSSSKAAREVSLIAQGVHQLYAHKNSYWMLSSDSLKSNNILILKSLNTLCNKQSFFLFLFCVLLLEGMISI